MFATYTSHMPTILQSLPTLAPQLLTPLPVNCIKSQTNFNCLSQIQFKSLSLLLLLAYIYSSLRSKNQIKTCNLKSQWSSCNNNNNGPLTVVLSVSMKVIQNFPCFYRWVPWVWCHIMTSSRGKLMFKIDRLLIGQFVFTFVSHMINVCFEWLWLVNSGHMTKTICHAVYNWIVFIR